MTVRRLRMWTRRFIYKLIVKLTGAKRKYKKERRNLPENEIGSVSIYAREPLAQDLTNAVLQLRDHFPYGYALVQRYVCGIVQSDLNPALGGVIGVLYEKANAEGGLTISAKRYAAYLVRLAIGVRLSSGFS